MDKGSSHLLLQGTSKTFGITNAKRDLMSPSADSSPSSDALELQEVLTRYIDSRDGYLQAAELAQDTGLSAAFAAIAERREIVASRIAQSVGSLGKQPDLEGSPEAGLHRWWIRLKDRFAAHESKAVIAECLRGEKELARTLEDALTDGHLDPAHAALVSEALDEVRIAIGAFENVVEEG